MKISVITPTFNRAATLKNSFDTVREQTLAPFEHIIADNVSSDGTPQVVEEYRRQAPYQVVYVREPDTGMYAALNKGLARATGDAIYILNDDDAIFDKDVFQIMAACLEETGTDLVYGDVDWLDPETGRRSRRRHNQVNKMTLIHKGMNQPAILHRAPVFKQCGIYDEEFRIAGDHEWLLRAFVKFNVSATYLRLPVAVCALGGMSNSDSFATRRSAERKKATDRWFTQRQIERSNTYRRLIRRFPFGTQAFDLFEPLKLRIRSVKYGGGRFVGDLTAWLGF